MLVTSSHVSLRVRFKHCLQGTLCKVGLQRYIFPRYDTYLDTRATIRYSTVRDKTSYQQLTLLLNNYFHNNKLNTVIAQHQIALQGLKCRTWVRNIKDCFPKFVDVAYFIVS